MDAGEPPQPSLLTAIMPTRNRPDKVAAQVRFLAECAFPYPLVIADSSASSDPGKEPAPASEPPGALNQHRRFDPEIGFIDKLATVVGAAQSPFILLLPDDDVTFPHAVHAALGHLQDHPEDVVAQGYVLRSAEHQRNIDIHRVFLFTPSIGQQQPLHRHYHLMRRYQPYFWAVFRREVLHKALLATAPVKGYIFQEVMLMNAIILQGGFARLRSIFNLRGSENSQSALQQIDPLHWFLDDPQSLFDHYTSYRHHLMQFLTDNDIAGAGEENLGKLIDMVHATWLGHNLDLGMINHVACLLLGDPLPPLQPPPIWDGWQDIAEGDVAHASSDIDVRYVWRKGVLTAEPREEISILPQEMEVVERQFDLYLRARSTPPGPG
ncbi:MAG: TIGR00180 family glycosyltransferase [Methylobacteriaceae bacterium]|nr:TIGR00180 family glycosyltransferase [Methylobacteriaceae bacterium]